MSGELNGLPYTPPNVLKDLLQFGVSALQYAAEQQEQAFIDSLTGLPNRRFFDEELALEVARMQRYSSVTSALFLDLDHFKNINDTYGHQAGDEALKTVAGVLKGRLRTSDIAARYGGEELVVLLPGDDELIAALVAEELRHEIATTPINFENHQFHVRTSIGVAEIDPFAKSDELLKDADEALYAAKRQGRDRVVRYSDYISAS